MPTNAEAAPEPRRRVSLDEPRAGALTVRYQPDAETVHENPPRFVWLPTLDESAPMVVRVSPAEGFPAGTTRHYTNLPRNFFTPDHAFEPGTYWWSYAVWDPIAEAPASDWSRMRTFIVPDGLDPVPLPSRAERARRLSPEHPRLWLSAETAATFASVLRTDPDHCGFRRFYERSVVPWIGREIIAEPLPYPDNIRTAEFWRQVYLDCQEVLYAIRHLAIAGRLLDDAALTARARDWLLSVARWDVNGPTSRSYNDEAAFRITTALAWGYDWLHPALDPAERELVRTALLERTRQIADHVTGNARLHIFPYDSHAIRALSAALVPCCLALAGEAEEADGWLDDTIEYLFTLYPPWGGADGGWAEGPHYWMTGMAYLLEAAGLLRNALDLDLLQRPFFRRTGYFPLYTKAPGTRRAAFGDDSTLGDPPGLKLGYNVRHFAAAAGDPHLQWYFETLKRDDPGTEHLFYNYGWWDFAFEDMVCAHDLPAIPAEPPEQLPALRVFSDIGWAAIQRLMDDPERHLQFLFKSSPYGSLSHSHADQNAFLLRAFGEDLAIQSGWYVAFNSTMHRDWRRQTRSKNALLIGGRGQYAGRDKALARGAGGTLLEARESEGIIVLTGDATAAYRAENPDVRLVRRDVHFVRDRYFVVVDRVELDTPQPLQWLFHASQAMELGAETFRVTGERAGLYGHFVLSTAGKPTLRQHEGFPGVAPEEIEGLARHWHVEAETPPASRHSLVTLLVPYRLDEPRRVLHFLDDQGFSCDLYFVDENDEFSLVVPKDF